MSSEGITCIWCQQSCDSYISHNGASLCLKCLVELRQYLTDSGQFRTAKSIQQHPYIKAKPTISKELRWEVWLRDNFTCRKCGARKYLSVDHIVPESEGGKTELANLQTLCEKCNSVKGIKYE